MWRSRQVHLVTYATTDFRPAQERLARSAREHGHVDHVYLFGPSDIQSTAFYARHRAILDAPRGAGYWLWKPYLILERLKHIPEGDFVIYSDSGRSVANEYRRPVDPLLEWATELGNGVMPGISIPYAGEASKWTKRDCFFYMDCDTERFWQHPQIQATHSVWQKCDFAMNFAASWLKYCCDERLITDAPNTCGLDNFSAFIDHRHDQSILTNLVIRGDLRFIDGSLGLAGYVRPLRTWDQDLWKNINNVILRARGRPASIVYATEVVRHCLQSSQA